MRRVLPLILATLAASMAACTEPPKPEKAKELDALKKGGDAKAKGGASDLGPIPDGPIAVVAGKEIGNDAFRQIYDLKVKKYEDRGRDIPASADRRYRKSIAERLIYQEVLRQESAKQEVKYDEEDLKKREEQQKRGIRDWEKHLSRRGETEQSLRDMYIAELTERALLEKGGKLEVNDEEIDAEYEKIKGNYKSDKPRVRASHILVTIGPPKERPKPGEKPPELSDEEKAKFEKEALAKANEVYELAKQPDADFAKLAEEHSTGPSANKGGDLGIFTADRMVEEFSEVAFKLKKGGVSKPVKTKFGYHVIKVFGKWGAGELPKEALVDQIRERMKQRKLHQGRRELKQTLLDSYEIVDNIKPTLGPDPTPRRRPGAKGGRAAPGKPPHGGAKAGAAKAGKAEAKAPAKAEQPEK